MCFFDSFIVLYTLREFREAGSTEPIHPDAVLQKSRTRETACHGCRTRGKNKDFHLPSNTTSKKKQNLRKKGWTVVLKVVALMVFGMEVGNRNDLCIPGAQMTSIF